MYSISEITGGGGKGGTVPPPQFCQCKNSGKKWEKIGQILGKYSGDPFFFFFFFYCLLVNIMLSGILGACMYPYADTGLEKKICVCVCVCLSVCPWYMMELNAISMDVLALGGSPGFVSEPADKQTCKNNRISKYIELNYTSQIEV